VSIINVEALTALKNEQLQQQSRLPAHSLDWNIMQGKIDLLNQVLTLITHQPPAPTDCLEIPVDEMIAKGDNIVGNGKQKVHKAKVSVPK
jgi:hypothetical protein